jgi:MFS family permease
MEADSPALSAPPQRGFAPLRAFSSLRRRNFRVFWLGQSISLAGSGMQSIGQAWLVLELTHSAFQIGLVGALQALPILLFSLVGGVLADRWPKRRVLLWTRAAAMVQALLLWALIATGAIRLWEIYVLALLLGLTYCLGRPAGQAFVVELVGRAELPNAVALNSSIANLARIVGPGLGGVIIAASGVGTLFLLNALSYIAALAGLALINSRELHAQAHRQTGAATRPTAWQSLREGISYVWKTPAISWLIVVGGLALLFGSNFGVVLPLLSTRVLHVGATGFGFLSAASGAGALIGTLWMAWSNRQPTIRAVLAATFAFGVLEVVFAESHLYPLSLALIAGVGGAEIIFAMLAVTMLQTISPDHLRGRVMSVCSLFFDGSLPLGYLMMGWLTGRYGPSSALLIGALLSLLVAGAGWAWSRQAIENAAEAART